MRGAVTIVHIPDFTDRLVVQVRCASETDSRPSSPIGPPGAADLLRAIADAGEADSTARRNGLVGDEPSPPRAGSTSPFEVR